MYDFVVFWMPNSGSFVCSIRVVINKRSNLVPIAGYFKDSVVQSGLFDKPWGRTLVFVNFFQMEYEPPIWINKKNKSHII